MLTLSLALSALLTLPEPALSPPEPARPLLHFTPPRNWTNDPNGLIYHNGEYHLFYQHNPFGDQWGHMSWGHAVSKDLFSWEHLPVAIPEADGVMIFSGTAVFDRDNTSGLGSASNPPLIAAYTGHDTRKPLQHQNIAFSTDRGRTWSRFPGNPVIDIGAADFRDPKVFWHTPTKRWVMVVALAAEKRAFFYSSPDLKQWTKLSEFGAEGRTGVPNWECPDLFEMPIEGSPGDTRWILTINVGGNGPAEGSGCQYFVGRFDGTRFINDNKPDEVLWLDRGRDFYAFQSFNDAPDNKRIGLAWMVSTPYAHATPTTPYRGSMTIPREYTLVRTPEGLRLAQRPLSTTTAYLVSRGAKETRADNQPITAKTPRGAIAQATTALIEAEFEPGSSERFGIKVREGSTEFTAVGFDVKKQQLFIDRRQSGRVDFHPQFPGIHTAPLSPPANGRVKLIVVVDQGSVETFSGDGLASITSLIFPKTESQGISLFADGGDAKLVRLSAVGLGAP